MKKYDQVSFDSWYRDKDSPVGSRSALARSVALAVALTESILDRPLRSVLDVGCGEGRWQPELNRQRPRASYLGIDSSEYAVERFGARRNLMLGSFEDLELHVFDSPFDLVICSDVMHYLTDAQIIRGLPSLVDCVEGVALLDVFTGSDEVEGDHVDFQLRSAAAYRKMFRYSGLVPIGMQAYVPLEVAEILEELDLPG